MVILDTLLGAPGSDQSQAMGLLAAGLLKGDFGGGLLAANGVFSPEAKLKRDYLQAQLANMQAEAQARQGAIDAARKKQEALPGLFGGGGYTGGEAKPQEIGGVPMFSQPLGVTPMRQQPMSFDVRRAALLGFDPDEIKKYAGLTDLGRPEVARTIEGTDAQGRKIIRQFDKFGNEITSGATEGYVAPVEVSQGDRKTFVRPAPGISLPVFQSPDSRAANAVAIRGQNLVNDRAIEQNRISAQGNGIKLETELRKEFADLPEVKNYKLAYPSFKAIADAAKSNTRQADINLIYGLAKLYDPTSVVREGEYNTIANSQAIPDWLKGAAQGLNGGSRLSSDTKNQILEQAKNRVLAYQHEHDKARATYTEIASQRGIKPENVFTPIGSPMAQSMPSNPNATNLVRGARYEMPDGSGVVEWDGFGFKRVR